MSLKRIMPPTWLVAAVLLMVGLHVLLPVRRVVPRPFNYGGIVLIVAGVLVNIWADGLFKKRRTTVKPFETSSELVTDGPFRFSRHPMYVGMVAVLVGLAVLLGTAGPMPVVIGFVVLVRLHFIPAEERALAETFGEAYRRYARRVRRWL